MALTALLLLLAACAAPSALIPSPTSATTPSPSTTPEPTLSPSPSPAASPFLEPSLTPIASSILASQTPGEAVTLDCTLLMQNIKNGTHFKSRDEFSITWKVRNTGTAGWDPGSVDFTYLAGTRMFQYPLVQLQGTVAPGNVTLLNADMRAPRNPGRYSTTWSLRQGDTYFCHLSLTINVDS